MFTKDSKSFGLKLTKEVKSITLKYNNSEIKTFEFDRLGRVIFIEENSDLGYHRTEYRYTQNEAGEIVCTNHDPGCALFIWTYNKYGLLTTTHYRNSDNTEGRLLRKNTYDSKGRIVTTENFEFNEAIKDTIIYEPDEGVIVKEASGGYTKYNKYGVEEYVDYGNGTRDSFCITKYEYYGNKLLKSELELIPNGDTICFNKYDKNGNLILKEEKQYIKHTTLVSTKFVYDKYNRVVEKIRYEDGKETERRKYVYNYKGDKKSENNDSNVKTFYLETDKYGNPLNYIIDWIIKDSEDDVKIEYTYFE